MGSLALWPAEWGGAAVTDGGMENILSSATICGVTLSIPNLSGLQSPYRLHEATSPCPGGHLKSTCVVSLNYRFPGPILGMGYSGL